MTFNHFFIPGIETKLITLYDKKINPCHACWTCQGRKNLERAAVVLDMNKENLSMKYKVGASVVSLRRGGGLNAVDAMNHFFLNHEMIVVGSTYWNMVYSQLSREAEMDLEGIENMKSIGQNMACILKKINNDDLNNIE